MNVETTNKTREGSSPANRTEKNVPSLRFSEFSGDWNEKKFEDIADIRVGGDLKNECFSERKTKTFKFPVFSNTVSSKGMYGFYNYPEFETDAVTIVGRGIGLGTAFSRVGLNGFTTIGRLLTLFPLKQSFDSTFLTNYINSKVRFYNESSGIPQLPSTALIKYKVKLPTLPEQQKIASFLSSVDSKISLLQEKHCQLQQYKKGVMQQLFSQNLRFTQADGSAYPDWEEMKIYDLIDNILDYRGRTPKKLGMSWGDGNIISLSANNVKNGFIDLDAECNLGSDALYNKWMDNTPVKKGDVIFTMEAPLGNACLIPDEKKYILSQRVVCFQLKEKVSNSFFIQFIWSSGFQRKINMLATGTTAKGINQKSLSKVKALIPCFKEQQKIAECLIAIDAKIDTVVDQLASVQAFKKGLLQKMFV